MNGGAAPRSLWDAEAMTALGEGILQIRLPMRGNPLRYVNAYLVEDDDGLTLIDCGWKTDDVRAALEASLTSRGVMIRDIARLVVTHFHQDHYGLAATLLREGVGSLGMHEADWRVADFILSDPGAADGIANAWLLRNGYAVHPSQAGDEHVRRSERAEPTTFLSDGVAIGRLIARWTPGHSPGHLCFWDRRTKQLFSGDHVLRPVTPHVGVWYEDRRDPLGEYLQSLRAVASMDVVRALPAHGEPFDDVGGRVRELVSHHEHRDALVVDALRSGPKSAAAVAATLPWTRKALSFAALSEPHREFAVAETIAHLEHARTNGAAFRESNDVRIVYALAG